MRRNTLVDHVAMGLALIGQSAPTFFLGILFILLLSLKAGLRAGEIANLTWPMILNPDGRVGDWLELHDIAAKKRSGRVIPLHPLDF